MERSDRILTKLQSLYPGKATYDLSGTGEHFVCEVEPTNEHPEYDDAVEVIIKSEPHKHFKMTQTYTVLEDTLTLHVDDKVFELKKGDTHIVTPGQIHWAFGNEKTLCKIHSEPGWTKEDHLKTSLFEKMKK